MTFRFAVVAAISLTPATGLPTMIRLGYPNCASCHVSPQGGGLLNEYGRGIDEAQSLRAGEYDPDAMRLPAGLSLGGRFDQDFRALFSDAVARIPGGDVTQTFRARFYARSLFALGKGWRISATMLGENEPSPRRSFLYDPAFVPGEALVATALIQYRPRDGIELAVGRDQLPMGVNTGDLATLVKSRNRYGYYDTPTQAKLFLWGKRWQIIPYAFVPRGTGMDEYHERGGGALAECDLLGKGKTVVGVNALRGADRLGTRNFTGAYTRLGFGRWGILAEQDFTQRSLAAGGSAGFGQTGSYIQAFRAFREWLVASAIFERLTVQDPYRERLVSGRGELFARLTPNFTLGLRAGAQFDQQTGRAAPVVTFQLAWKTVGLRPW